MQSLGTSPFFHFSPLVKTRPRLAQATGSRSKDGSTQPLAHAEPNTIGVSQSPCRKGFALCSGRITRLLRTGRCFLRELPGLLQSVSCPGAAGSLK
jgi:hypothetical protein